MLLKRIITALVLICALIFCLWHEHPNYWRVFVGLITLAAWWEWLGVANMRKSLPKSLLYSCLFVLVIYGFSLIGFSLALNVAMAVLWIVLLFFTLNSKLQNSPIVWSDTSKALIGVVVLAYFACGAIWLKELIGGYVLIIFAAVIWIADSGAYFTGKRWGKRKLAPTVSPGKSIEGVLGGLTLVAVYVLALYFIYDQPFPLFAGLVSALIIGIVSVGGDLYESWLKRQAGIKDSGKILPGHGGVLDRIDSLLAALPFMVIASTILVI